MITRPGWAIAQHGLRCDVAIIRPVPRITPDIVASTHTSHEGDAKS
jgi:hypothetical protein